MAPARAATWRASARQRAQLRTRCARSSVRAAAFLRGKRRWPSVRTTRPPPSRPTLRGMMRSTRSRWHRSDANPAGRPGRLMYVRHRRRARPRASRRAAPRAAAPRGRQPSRRRGRHIARHAQRAKSPTAPRGPSARHAQRSNRSGRTGRRAARLAPPRRRRVWPSALKTRGTRCRRERRSTCSGPRPPQRTTQRHLARRAPPVRLIPTPAKPPRPRRRARASRRTARGTR